MRTHRASHESGSAVILALATILVLGLVAGRVISWMTDQMQTRQKVSITAGAALARQHVINRIENDLAWSNTVASNLGLTCLRINNSDCSGLTNAAISLRGADNIVAVGTTPAGELGFTADGAPCVGFTNTPGNDACPLKYTLQISAICGGGPCNSIITLPDTFARTPEVRVRGVLTFQPEHFTYFGTLNPENYLIDYTRTKPTPPDPDIIEGDCSNFGGTFNPTTGSCDLPVLNIGQCPAGYFLLGVRPDMTANCRASYMVPSKCIAGAAVVGISPWGEFTCGKF